MSNFDQPPAYFEGIGSIPLEKPRLSAKMEKRNRPVRAIGSIYLRPVDGFSIIGGIIHIIAPNTTGFVIDHAEDFSLNRIDVACLKEYVCERDEIFVIFEMHVIAKIPVKAIEFLEKVSHAST